MSSLPLKEQPALEQLAAEHQFGTLLKSYNQHRAGMAGTWLMFGFSFLSFWGTFRLIFDDTQDIWLKITLSLVMFPFGFLLLYAGFNCLQTAVKINSKLRGIKDESLSNYHSILLYERGLICYEWTGCKGTWNNHLRLIPWNAISCFQSSKTIQPGGTSEDFFIKTKDGQTINISPGGQELVTAIEQRMNATFTSVT